MTETASAVEDPALEAAIATLTRAFYERARQDPLLGPVFDSLLIDWDHHFGIVSDFWSKALLKTERYEGHPFPVHLKLPVEPEHFDRWVELFAETANEVLPPAYAKEAITRATTMGKCFKIGIFPFFDKEGRMSRAPG